MKIVKSVNTSKDKLFYSELKLTLTGELFV